jgi:hypothetical protein
MLPPVHARMPASALPRGSVRCQLSGSPGQLAREILDQTILPPPNPPPNRPRARRLVLDFIGSE